MLQMIRVIIPTATEVEIAILKLGARSHMVPEKITQSILSNHSMSKLNGELTVHSPNTSDKVIIQK